MLMRAALGLCLMMAGCEADVSKQEESLARPARLITVGIGNRLGTSSVRGQSSRGTHRGSWF